MTSTAPPTPLANTVELKPSYKIPLVLILAAIPLIALQKWVALGVGLFGIFLLVQAATLRLQFTLTDLDIYRSEKLIRQFPYRDWQNWQIFWRPVPILFYFKEVKSIHFLPIIFDPRTLQQCLQERIACDRDRSIA
jgi:hypothetical protein